MKIMLWLLNCYLECSIIMEQFNITLYMYLSSLQMLVIDIYESYEFLLKKWILLFLKNSLNHFISKSFLLLANINLNLIAKPVAHR